MSIEGGAATTSPKTVTGAENQGSKARIKLGGGGDTPAAGGFMALLSALESQAGAGDEGVAATDQIDDGSRQAATQNPPMGVMLPLSDPSMTVAQNPPTDLAMLLAQAGEGGGDKLGVFSEVPHYGGWAGLRLAVDAMATAQRGAPLAASAALGAEKSGHLKHNVNALLDQTAQSAFGRTPKGAAGGTGSQSGAGVNNLMESRSLHLSSFMDAVAREPAVSGALVSSGMGEGLLRQADRAGAKSSVLQGASGVEGLWGQPASLSGNNGVDAPAAPADPSMLSFESRLAETVSYWATQGVQNAELTLDGPGGETVEVRISLKGEDAHIDFRTDQPEIRRVLEGAAAHLKDILASEGLVLSGVSVGSSGRDGASAQEQRHRPGARQTTLITSGVAPAEARLQIVQSIARAVDIFV